MLFRTYSQETKHGSCRHLCKRKGKQQFEPFKQSETLTARWQQIHQDATKSCGSEKLQKKKNYTKDKQAKNSV